MKAVLLGTGTSTGVPIIGKPYDPAYLADPRNHRMRCACLLRGPEGDVLVDAGPDLRTQLLRAGATRPEAVLITHTHADHIMGMDDLRAFCLGTDEPVHIHTSPEHQQVIRQVFHHAFKPFPPGIFVPRFELHDVGPGIGRIQAGGLEITTFWVEHGPMKVMGLRVGGFAYITDVSGIPEEVWPVLDGLDDLVLDAVRFHPHPNHFHFDRALEEAARIGARTTWLTHLSDDYDFERESAGLPDGVRLSWDGLEIEIRH
ncbi:MAG: MBL fold metallo-hydrolase [Fimbriimonadaceae bacterium]|nr:MBL fold metallo-hydrolase [Fimbriimonadaceae bacterium]